MTHEQLRRQAIFRVTMYAAIVVVCGIWGSAIFGMI